jgi:hypothetical protein
VRQPGYWHIPRHRFGWACAWSSIHMGQRAKSPPIKDTTAALSGTGVLYDRHNRGCGVTRPQALSRRQMHHIRICRKGGHNWQCGGTRVRTPFLSARRFSFCLQRERAGFPMSLPVFPDGRWAKRQAISRATIAGRGLRMAPHGGHPPKRLEVWW